MNLSATRQAPSESLRPDEAAVDMPRSRTWAVGPVSMLIVASVVVALFLRNHRYFYIDDRQADGVAKLVDQGRILLSGEWPWLSINVVNSGGYAVEYQNGVFNPANLALGVVMSRLDDMALASFLQMLFHTLLLTGAAAWLGRLLGLSRVWTIAFAVAVGLQPYTIFWSAGWYQVTVSFSWFVLAVAAAFAMHLRPRRRYGWTLLVATYCCYTSGWPLAIPMLAVVIVVLLAARLVSRRPPLVTGWIAAWFGAGALASLVALYPLMVSFTFASRQSVFSNDQNFQVVPLEGLLHFADPTYWPWLNNFGGFALQHFPHFYVAWFVLPVLVLWRRGPLSSDMRVLWVSNLVLLGIAVVGALGPERALVFRFPMRFAQYTGFFLLLVTAVWVANGRMVVSRRRLWVLVGSVLLLLLNSVQSDPSGLKRILGLGAVLLVLCLGVWWAGVREGQADTSGTVAEGNVSAGRSRTGRTVGVQTVVVAGTVLLVGALAFEYPMGRGLDWGFPHDLSAAPRLSQQDYTLFYGSYPPLDHPDRLPSPALEASVQQFYREYRASSMGLLTGDRQVNGYSPLGYTAFRARFPMDDQGNFGDHGAEQFTAIDRDTGLSWLEMLRVDQVVTQLGTRDDQLRKYLGPRWTRVSTGVATATYRHAPYRLPGLVSYVSAGTEVSAAPDCPLRASTECVQVRSTTSIPSQVTFARLWFPGYSASLDGVDLPVTRRGDMLVTVNLPAGASGRVVLHYQSPGFVPLAALAALVVAAIAIASIVFSQTDARRLVLSKRRRRANHTSDERPPDRP